ncbi:MAG: glycosyltransferase [Phycisphaerales bacterium]
MSRSATLGVTFIGGGTGGHIYPSLAVAEALASIEPSTIAVFLTGDRDADAQALEDQRLFDSPAHRVALGARPPSRKPRAMLACVRSWGKAVRDSREALRELKSSCDRVVAMSTGGYVSAPAAQAARVERVPLVLVGLDARLGKANRFVARRAAERLVAQDEAPNGWHAIGPIVGQRAKAPADAARCRQQLGLDPDLPTLLVMGGSQGARSINQFLAAIAEHESSVLRGWQVIHLAGDAKAAASSAAALDRAGIPNSVLERMSPIGPAWGAASAALCRAGAGTVAEAHANAVPALYLPYPYHADQHQGANAQPIVDAGGGVLVRDRIDPRKNLEAILPELVALLRSTDKRQAMAAALQKLPRKDGAQACANTLIERATSM